MRLQSEGSFIDAELIARASRRGFRVIQFGVDYFPRTRGISTLSSLAVIRTMLREMASQAAGIRAHKPLPAEWLELPESDAGDAAPRVPRAPTAVSRH